MGDFLGQFRPFIGLVSHWVLPVGAHLHYIYNICVCVCAVWNATTVLNGKYHLGPKGHGLHVNAGSSETVHGLGHVEHAKGLPASRKARPHAKGEPFTIERWSNMVIYITMKKMWFNHDQW